MPESVMVDYWTSSVHIMGPINSRDVLLDAFPNNTLGIDVHYHTNVRLFDTHCLNASIVNACGLSFANDYTLLLFWLWLAM